MTKSVFSLGGEELPTPSILELLYPDMKHEDTRTAAEILDDIESQLTMIAAREEEARID